MIGYVLVPLYLPSSVLIYVPVIFSLHLRDREKGGGIRKKGLVYIQFKRNK